ncbi:hypothetical protein WME76_05615 [Sorangium sp. So ce119]|uniref:hypothetical protein n=1 Tax=Sorangium sp. So ce119 TaxID=3133279 RepID=UPI003F63746D
MARFLVFAAWTPEDAALWNSRWMAEQTIRLAAEAEAVAVKGDHAVREMLESALEDSALEGVALFGHGLAHAVMGSDAREALDATNAARVGPRWAHAMACNTGVALVPACAAHAGLFVGYDVRLIVEWTVEELPDALRELLARLVTATTLGLLAGVRARTDLQRRAAAAADELTAWVIENAEDGYLGVLVLAQQLVDRMVVSR